MLMRETVCCGSTFLTIQNNSVIYSQHNKHHECVHSCMPSTQTVSQAGDSRHTLELLLNQRVPEPELLNVATLKKTTFVKTIQYELHSMKI